MHIAAAARGNGVGRRLLAHLLDAARPAGHREMPLEAGRSDAHAAPARALCTGAGVRECPPFGAYRARAASIFLSRAIQGRARARVVYSLCTGRAAPIRSMDGRPGARYTRARAGP